MNKKRKINVATKMTALAIAGAVCLGSSLWIPGITAKAEAIRQEGTVIHGQSAGSLTVRKHGASADIPLGGASFSVYRIMELTPAVNVGDYASYKKADEFAEVLEGITPDDLGNYSSVQIEELAIDLKAAASENGVQPDGTAVTGEDGICNFTDLPLGYYLVVETEAPEGYVTGSPFLIAIPSTDNYNTEDAVGTSWVYDVEAEPKNAQVGIEKQLAGEEDGSVKEGDYVQYLITTAIPAYPDEYFNKDVTFTIRDIMSDGLQIQNSTNYPVVVKVGNVQIQEGADTYSVQAIETSGETPDLTIDFAKNFIKEHRLEEVTVNYYAKVTSKAITGIAGNSNSASLVYNHKNGETSTAEGTDVKVYTFELDILKFTEEEEAKALSGAKFELCNDPEFNNLIQSGISDSEGMIYFERLDAGTYYLKEVQSPKGYTLLANPIKIEIIADEAEGQATGTFTLKVDGKEVTTVNGEYISKIDVENGIATIAVENHKGFSLPATGGMGVALFFIIGAAGVVTVSVVVTKKMKKNL